MAASRILIASDSEICIEMVKGFLKQSPVQTFIARNYDQIVSICRKASPELLVLDQHLAGKDAAPFCEEVRKASQLNEIPILILASTNRDQSESILPDQEDSITFHLPKPLNRKMFLEAGRILLEKIERRELRIPCRAMASCRQDNLNFFGTIEDVSPQGLFIGTEFSAKTGSQLSLRFMLPWQEGLLIETEARVAWRNTEKSNKRSKLPPGLGIEFLNLTEDDENQLRDFITRSTLRLR